jgi:hypothetical protein
MPAFKFNSAPVSDFVTPDYYLVVVQSVPLISLTIRSGLSEPPGFPPFLLTGKVVDSEKVTFTDGTIPTFTYPNAIAGIVLVQRTGVSAPSGSDSLVAFIPFTNSLGQDFIASAGTFSIPLDFGVNGLIDFVATYRYSSGTYIAGAVGSFPQGLFYLIGTKNNTEAFVTPSNDGLIAEMADGGVLSNILTDRLGNTAAQTDQPRYIDFQESLVRVGGCAFRGAASGASVTFTLSGSNSVASFTYPGMAAASWTSLCNGVGGNNSYGPLQGSVNSSTYWRYLRITSNSPGGTQLTDLELFNSTIETKYLNMVVT